MKKSYQLHSAVVAVLLGLSNVLLTSPVFADEAQFLNDRLAIATVIAQSSYTWDSKEAEAYANLFTKDAVWEIWLPSMGSPWLKLKTRQAIVNNAKTAHSTRLAKRQTRHHQSALIFHEISAVSAYTQNMVLITHQASNDKAPCLEASLPNSSISDLSLLRPNTTYSGG